MITSAKLQKYGYVDELSRFADNFYPPIAYYPHITNKKQQIPLIRKLIDPDATLPEKINESVKEMMLRLTGIDISCCPQYKKGKMIRIR